MSVLISIPARYASTRLPGKPLVQIKGREMILRVHDIAAKVAKSFDDVSILIATEDQRIVDFCDSHDLPCILTPDTCRTGTDRVRIAAESLDTPPDFVVNLQGDNPFCPHWFLEDMIQTYLDDPSHEVLTPCVQLSWDGLDGLRVNKQQTPFSGTTVVKKANNDAFWFSKNIIPAIRKEDALRKDSKKSPVWRHIGLYGYRFDILQKIADLPEGVYEKLEGLEQLRFLENGIRIGMVDVDYRNMPGMSGIDSPEDIARAEKLLSEMGE